MIGLYVTVPIACFRKGLAREYLETEELPPPSTCYGFLLSLVGETDRRRHVGCRVTAGLLTPTECSVVLRTVWRIKKATLGSPGNTRPDYQQLLTGDSADDPFIRLVMWLDSGGEAGPAPNLEDRVRTALDPARRACVNRFGGLSLGESAHLVDEVRELPKSAVADKNCRLFVLADRGRMTLPVWVDHVGSSGTRYVTGDLLAVALRAPAVQSIPEIQPPEEA